MNERLFTSLLKRAFAVPILTLLVLALTMFIGLRQLERSAQWVDHTDQVISHANRLTRLMIDQETGLRGFLAFGSRDFLEPYERAQPQIEREFSTIFNLIHDNPEQAEQLTQIRSQYDRWLLAVQPELTAPRPDTATSLQRKRMMDQARAELDKFIAREEQLRVSRATLSQRLDLLLGAGSFVIAAVVGLLIALYVARILRDLVTAYTAQLSSVEEQRAVAIASEGWLRTTLHSIGDAVIASDREGHVVLMNRVAEVLTGWTNAEAQGRPLYEVFRIINETSRAPVESPVDKVRRLGVVVGLANHTLLIRRDGVETHIDDSGAPILDQQGAITGIVLIFRDINDRRKAERALVKAEKLASAGRLSAAIAHEVNNPLEALTNLLYLASREAAQPEVRQKIEQAEIEVSRIAHITRQSLGFYKEDAAASIFSVANLVNQAVSFYSSRATVKGVLLRTAIVSDVEIFGSTGELRQILSNLISNALDALDAGGTMVLLVRRDRDEQTGKPGARIVVADSGCGIERSKLAAIFEPFYTTKGSTGTGLGLWVTRQLLEKHHGRVRVRSATAGSRRGTTFRLFLPAVPGELEAASRTLAEGLMAELGDPVH